MARSRRTDGRICVRVDTGEISENYTRVRKYFYGKTLKEATAKRDAWLMSREQEARGLNVNIQFNDWSDAWLESVRSTMQETSYKNIKSCVNEQKKHFDGIKLYDLKPIEIQSYMNELKDKSKSTISKRRYVMKAILDSAVANGMIEKNPWVNIRVPKGHYSGHRALTRDEIDTITNKWDDCRGSRWAVVMLYTGMRKEELSALESTDIDWKNNCIHISRASVLKDGGRIKEPKTSAGVRTVPILPQIVPCLKQCQSGRLFLSAHGQPLNDTSFKRGWQSMCHRLNVNIQPHDLRTTYATILYDAGVDILTASKLLGHSDIKVTLGIYTKLSAQKQQTGIDKLLAYGGQMGVKSEIPEYTD